MNKISIIILMIVLPGFAFSQDRALDSMKNVMVHAKHDTIKLYTLNKLIEISPDVEWQAFNEQMGSIVKKIIDANKSDARTLHVAKRFYAAYINNIGYDAFQRGDVARSIECYHQSLKMYEAINETYDMALAYNNLGYMYYSENDHAQALKYYQMSLRSYKEINHSWGIALCYNNIGLCYFSKFKPLIGKKNNTDSVEYYFGKALWYYTNAYQLQEHGDDLYAFGTSCNNLGTVYCLKGEHYLGVDLKKDSIDHFFNKSIDYHMQGLKIFTDFGNNGGIVDCKNNMGYTYFLKNDFKKALMYCEDALAIAKEHNLPQKVSQAAKHLYRIYNKRNNTKDALAMYMLHIQMRDSIANEKNKKELIQKDFQYKYDKKTLADSVKIAAEKKVTDAQFKQEQTQRYALYIGLFIVIVFSVFLFNRFKVTQKQKSIIQLQKHEVEENRKEILDSIHYAKRIQDTLLAHRDFLDENLPNNFVLFKPKDIVSGDFYWATKHGNKFYLAVCDSTGHGVPGAFMSLLNIGFLSEAINEKNILEPHKILNHVRQRLISGVSKDGQKDGFDGILLCIDQSTNEMTYAAAHNAPILVSGNETIELPKDKMPVGIGERTEEFKLYTIKANKGDTLYLYTDGYADQFGGPRGKKFKYKPLNELLVKNTGLPLNEQGELLFKTFDDWRGNLEQVDDMLIIGIKL